jgi:hypothetical protein
MTITRKNELHDINHLLQNGSSSHFVKIVQKAQILEKINHTFKSFISADFVAHCYITDFTKETLHLLVENSAWATMLHYRIPEIIKSLSQQSEFRGLKTIKYKIKKINTYYQ